MPELLYAAPSPFVRKVRIVAAELGLPLTLTEVAASPVAAAPEVTARNPLGKIPALVTPDAGVLYDSAVICAYLGAGSALYPEGGAGWQARRREALADGLIDAALLARYETTLRPEALRWPDWTAGQMDKVHRALAAMAEDPSHPEAPDIGDIATGCALGYLDFRFPDLNWRGAYPALATLAGLLHARPAFLDTAP